MSGSTEAAPESRWTVSDAAWRDPEEVIAGWQRADAVDHRLLDLRVRGEWWEVLERLDACVVISREYEHLLLALVVAPEGPRQSFMSVPHPSGMAFDPSSEQLHVASTRNPNQLYVLAPVESATGADRGGGLAVDRPLVAVSARFLPGRLYLHDLVLIEGALHGNAVGLNAIVRLAGADGWEVVWWPRSIERDGQPDLSRNYLQLNSIAAGRDLASSFFSSSTDAPSTRRSGHRDFAVDKRGVIFSGATREPIARGLTRPHSARIHGEELWVDDSGYGRVLSIRDGVPSTVAMLPGWTRGLTFVGDVAFVGTSRVIPRFARYAPGLPVNRSVCAVHALDASTGEVLGSARWPAGNQVFDIAVLPRATTLGVPRAAAVGGAAASSARSSSPTTSPTCQECHDRRVSTADAERDV